VADRGLDHMAFRQGVLVLRRDQAMMYTRFMKMVFDLDDRARLRERFFGVTHTVLARLNGCA